MKCAIKYSILGFIFILASCKALKQTDDFGKKQDVVEQIDLDKIPAEAIPKVNQALPVNPALVSGYMPNGMQYFILPNQKPENRAELRLIVHAGSMQEDNDQKGLAHFVEHMAFNGSTNFKKNELVDFLESVGTKFGPDLNAYTSFDETVYMLQVRTDVDSLYNKGLLVLQDWAGGIAFDQSEIDKERGVILSEYRSSLSPNERMLNQYLPIIYNGSRYAERLPIGDVDIIKTANRDVMTRFYKDWYRPELMAIAVIGDVDVEKTKKKIKTMFGSIQSQNPARLKKSNVVPKNDQPIIAVVSDKEAPFTNVSISYRHPHKKTKIEKDFRRNLLHSLYNSMLRARFREISKQKDAPILFAYSNYGRDLGNLDAFDVSANVAEDKIEAGFKSMVRENKRVHQFGFTATELERALRSLTEIYKRNAADAENIKSQQLARGIVYHFLKGNPFLSAEQRLQLFNAYASTIQIEEINDLAKQWITPEKSIILITAPLKEELTLPTNDQVLQWMSEVEIERIEPYKDNVITEPLFNKSVVPGKIVSKSINEAVNVVTYTLSNGVRVLAKNTDFKKEEILMKAYSPGGHWYLQGTDYTTADVAASIVDQSGISKFSNLDLQKMLAGKKVRVRPYISNYSEGFNGASKPEDLELLFQMIHLYMTAPRENEDDASNFLSSQKGFLKNILSNPDYYFMDYTQKKYSNNSIKVGLPNALNLEQVDVLKSYAFYKERFANAGDFTFTFVGNFDSATFESYIKQYLASLPTIDRDDTPKSDGVQYVTGNNSDEFEHGIAEKSQVEILYHGPFDYTPENIYTFKSMIEVLRIKLRESLREDKGGVYGVRVSNSLENKPVPKYAIRIAFNSDPGREKELIDAVNKEIEILKLEGAQEKELIKVRETQIQSLSKQLKENRYWLNTIQSFDVNGWDVNKIGLTSLENSAAKLTGVDVQQATKLYFGDNQFKIVMKPSKK